jgi:TIR domain/Phage integrase family
MADVFISYAKTDRSLALKLVAMLEAEGWKVWWDTSLAIGDDFRNEIMTELGHARAVIVIWTDASIKSDWVRSVTTAWFLRMIQRTGEAAKLPFPIHPHMLRHSTGYKLANQGEDTRSLAHYPWPQEFAIDRSIYCACAGSVCEILEGLDCESPWIRRNSRGPLLPQRFSPDPR